MTLYDDRGHARTFLRRHGQPLNEAEAFNDCSSLFREVWTKYRPTFQATTGDGSFGVKRAGYKRGR